MFAPSCCGGGCARGAPSLRRLIGCSAVQWVPKMQHTAETLHTVSVPFPCIRRILQSVSSLLMKTRRGTDPPCLMVSTATPLNIMKVLPDLLSNELPKDSWSTWGTCFGVCPSMGDSCATWDGVVAKVVQPAPHISGYATGHRKRFRIPHVIRLNVHSILPTLPPSLRTNRMDNPHPRSHPHQKPQLAALCSVIHGGKCALAVLAW